MAASAGAGVPARRTSGSSDSRALGRPRVNGPMNRSQSMSATTTAVSSQSRARWTAVTASAAGRVTTPRRRRCSSSASVTMPPSAQGPQAIAVAVRPRALRRAASPSRKALPAA